MATENLRSNPASIKVVCLGLGRTGTSSLRDALEILGFGPCYHMSAVVEGGGKDFAAWSNVGDGNGTPENLDEILRGYSSVADYPAAMYPAELVAAYPDAKFILVIHLLDFFTKFLDRAVQTQTTRDPAKWEKSMKDTMLRVYAVLRTLHHRSELEEVASRWGDVYLEEKYHRGRIHTHAQQELLDHNERVNRIVPPEKLLIYQVGEGWDPLVHFLDVPKPEGPFPHVNDTMQFQETFSPYFKHSMDTNRRHISMRASEKVEFSETMEGVDQVIGSV